MLALALAQRDDDAVALPAVELVGVTDSVTEPTSVRVADPDTLTVALVVAVSLTVADELAPTLPLEDPHIVADTLVVAVTVLLALLQPEAVVVIDEEREASAVRVAELHADCNVVAEGEKLGEADAVLLLDTRALLDSVAIAVEERVLSGDTDALIDDVSVFDALEDRTLLVVSTELALIVGIMVPVTDCDREVEAENERAAVAESVRSAEAVPQPDTLVLPVADHEDKGVAVALFAVEPVAIAVTDAVAMIDTEFVPVKLARALVLTAPLRVAPLLLVAETQPLALAPPDTLDDADDGAVTDAVTVDVPQRDSNDETLGAVLALPELLVIDVLLGRALSLCAGVVV